MFSLLVLAQPALRSQASGDDNKPIQIGSIDYFGYAGLDLKQVEAQLPLHVGDSVSFNSLDRKEDAIKRVVQQLTGKPATDIAAVCCDGAHHLMIYIGLGGSSSRALRVNPPPHGQDHLDDAALKFYERLMDATNSAIRRGASSEDDSNGYALSADPRMRQVELEIRAYAASHGEELKTVLQNSSDAQQRRVSALLLGYANRSAMQIRSLAAAAADADSTVRNNAMRALAVLASAKETGGTDVDPAPFIALLYSGQWTDRNKSSWLLSQLTSSRDQILLKKLSEEALAPLIEGARWSDPGHSMAFVAILGRIEGVPDGQLDLARKPEIIAAAEKALHEENR
jgi:hypothetical protein